MGVRNTRGLKRFTAAADQSAKEGYLVTLSASGVAVATGAADKVVGVITEGGETESDIALLGAIEGTVDMKAGGAITAGAKLMLMATGAVDASATGVCVGIAMEAAVSGELFEAAPLTPVTVS